MEAFLTVGAGDLAWIRREQMVAVDRAVMAALHVGLVQLMENAGRALAAVASRRFLDGDPVGRRVVVLAGTGGNGGGAMVCARRLSGWGAAVELVPTRRPEAYCGVPADQLDILERMGVPHLSVEALAERPEPDLVIDGLVGYSLAGAPRGVVAEAIRWANASTVPVLSLDLPSGLDATAGFVYEPTVRATATVTLALPKTGLRAPGAEKLVGELYLADIGVPPEIYRRPEIAVGAGPVFARGDILRVE